MISADVPEYRRGRGGALEEPLKQAESDAKPDGSTYAFRPDMATTLRANTFLQRLVGAAALDATIYEEVEADPGATAQAMAVVVLSSMAMAIGARGLGGNSSTMALFGVMALVTWASRRRPASRPC